MFLTYVAQASANMKRSSLLLWSKWIKNKFYNIELLKIKIYSLSFR